MKKYLLALPSSLFVSLWHYSWYKQNKAFSTKSFFTLRTSSLKLFILPVSFFFFFPVELSYLCNTESPFLIKITTELQFTFSISFLNVYCLFEQMEKKGSKCSALLQVIPDSVLWGWLAAGMLSYSSLATHCRTDLPKVHVVLTGFGSRNLLVSNFCVMYVCNLKVISMMKKSC